MVKTNYLGKRGFAIFKNKISLKEQFFIRNELNVRAYIPKSPVQPQPFKIFLDILVKNILVFLTILK